MAVRTIETRIHGRYLVREAAGAKPWPWLVGFHGYAEDAQIHLDALLQIAGIETWHVVSVQALHPFYTRDQRVVANWMTRQDRELAINDNIEYVGRVLAALQEDCGPPSTLVFAGFSQGGAMAYRAASRFRANGLLILAADVPPDVATATGASLPPTLIGRGERDEWYTVEKHEADLQALRQLGAPVESCVFDGGHEWTAVFYDAAAGFLSRIRSDDRAD